MQTWRAPLVLLTALATGLAVAWWGLTYSLGTVLMFDTNLTAFKDALKPEQAESILWRHQHTVWWASAPLVATNAAWVVIALGLLWGRRVAAASAGDGGSTTAA